MSHVVSARLQDSLYNFLESIAEKRQRKLSEIMLEALNSYAEEYADYQVALDRLHDHQDAIIDEKELKRRLKYA